MKCIVLAGGSGGSLWPLSRKKYPIQFAEIRDERSVFQENIARHLPYCDEFYIFTNRSYEYIVEGQLNVFQELKYKLFFEEEAVNTTLPVLLGLMYAGNENAMIIGCSSTYSGEGFRECFMEGVQALRNNNCVLFGMTVEKYDTNIGYIKHINDDVQLFIEKPSRESIENFLKNGDWLCNTGKYLINSIKFIEYIKTEFPEIYMGAEEAFNNCRSYDKKIIIPKGYKTEALNLSFERNILSRLHMAKVIELKDVEWNIVNSWEAIEKIIKQDAHADVVKQDCSNLIVINNAENKLVVANGVKNSVIVNTDDAIYIEGDSAVTDIKSFFLNHEDNYAEYVNDNNFRYRVWGKYTVVNKSKGYIVKKVIIYPGKEMSLHKHRYRSEHWAVVEGTAEITIDDNVSQYKPNTSVFVPSGSYHRIANRTERDVVIIEIEIGNYISEGDIISKTYVSEASDKFEIMKLKPVFKDYIWGGTRLRDEFNKDCNWDVIAESWEMSTHKDGNSIIDSGKYKGIEFGDFIEKYGDNVIGWKCRAFSKFPILIKFIDSKKPLSVQVHPDDKFAMKVEKEYGKNEMWYIVDCDKDAYIYCGFNRNITADEFNKRLKNKTITDVLNKIYVKKDEAYFIPAGTVHAIGEGILICEIQQNSNSTYRIYDYDRRDKNGKLRDLHVEKALQVINLNEYMPYINSKEKCVGVNNLRKICGCKYFEVSVAEIQGSKEFYVDKSSFMAVVVIEGKGILIDECSEIKIERGDTFFIPAGTGDIRIEGMCKVIFVHV